MALLNYYQDCDRARKKNREDFSRRGVAVSRAVVVVVAVLRFWGFWPRPRSRFWYFEAFDRDRDRDRDREKNRDSFNYRAPGYVSIEKYRGN